MTWLARHQQLAIILVMLACVITLSSGQEPESSILLKFKSSLENATSLDNWNASVQLCGSKVSNWNGVVCFNQKFIGLQLDSMGLSGTLDIDTLSNLTTIRTLSVMNNNFEGPFPDVKKLGGLIAVILSNNKFSGELPDDAFVGMNSLRRILLLNNGFTGKIPRSLVGLPLLLELQLQDNEFEGTIPAFGEELQYLNVANNRLEGPIPPQLSSQELSSFEGNLNLCGKPMAPCPPSKMEGRKPSKKQGIKFTYV